jgi:LytS/YehU family sensor histidine kinase
MYISRINPNYDILEGFFAFTITYALKYTWMALSTQNKMLALQKENLQLELKALKAQVNPHFLFNTLNNIYALSLQKSEETPGMLLKLSSMMRYLLYECNVPQWRCKKKSSLSITISSWKKFVTIKTCRLIFRCQAMPATARLLRCC